MSAPELPVSRIMMMMMMMMMIDDDDDSVYDCT